MNEMESWSNAQVHFKRPVSVGSRECYQILPLGS